MIRFGIISLALLASACEQSVAPHTDVDPVQEPVDGFIPFSSFRGADAPGTVFRVSADGEIRRVTLLNIPVHESAEATYNVSASREFTLQQLLNLTSGECSSVSQGFNPQLKGSVTVSSLDGIREYTYDDEIDRQIAALRHAFETGELQYREADRYYVIRETIKTSSINYSESSGWVVAANASADLQACADRVTEAEGSASVNFTEGRQLSLDRTFPEPLRGWYNADRLIVEMPFGAAEGTAPDISRADEAGDEVPLL